MTVANVNVTKVLFKRGNTVQNNNYTGINGELTIDTQAKTLRIHDGVTTGGNIVTAGAMASYIPIDPTITSIQANVAAANAAISSITGIDTSLLANAATQQTQINLLNANVSAANALIPNLLAVSSNILPSANVTYSLGSEQFQWKDLWVSNNTIYIGNTPLTISNGNLLVNGNLVTGSTSTIYSNANVASYLPTYSGDIAANITRNNYTWVFGPNGNLTLPSGGHLLDSQGNSVLGTVIASSYKGFRAHYGTMYDNTDDENGPINKLVIYKSTATPSSAIDADTSSDDFQVTGLTGSDVVAMLVVISDGTDWDVQTPVEDLKTFVEAVIDEVILDGGVEGDIRSIANMKAAFYSNFNNFSTIISNVKTQLEFFSVNNQFNISPQFQTGKGATFSGIGYNMADNTLDLGSWGQDVGTHQVGDVFVIPGNTIQDANSNFLTTPANDVTVTITNAPDGYIGSYTVTGTLPRPAETWPSNSISDGGDDEYDGANAIHTDLDTEISYNDGNVVTSSSAFGGGDYVVTYQAGIFGIFSTNAGIDIIGTSGDSGGYGNDNSSSGFDGDGIAVTGSLYSAGATVDLTLTGNIVSDNSRINFVSNSSGDGYGSSTIQLIPSTENTVGPDQYLIIDPTSPNHIHIRAGGTQDNSQSQLFLGGENSHFRVDSGLNPNVYISANGQTWMFGDDGELALPRGGIIAEGTSPTGVGDTITLTPNGGSATQALLIYPTGGIPEGDHIHLTAGGGATELYLGNDFHYVKLVNGGNVEIRTDDLSGNVGTWNFGANANLTLPESGYLKVGSGIVAGFASSPAPIISGFSSVSAENFRFQGNGVNILSTVDGTYSNTNVAAYLSTITTSNVGAGNLTVINNFSSNVISANSFTYANGVNILSTVASTYGDANVAMYLPTYTGNIAGNIVKNGYTWTFSNTGTTTFPTGVTLSNARGPNTVNFTTAIDKSFQIETQTSTTGRLWSFGTDGNLTLPQFANINFSNGVNILSTITAGSTYSNVNVEAYIGGNIGAYQTYANANAATQATSINTVNANIGSFQTYANATFSTSTYSNTTANALLSSNTVSTITTTGNIVTIANVIATTFRFANGVNILSTITAVANLNNLTGNINWTAVGANPPTFTTSSNGTKIVLWPSISSTMVDYAIGIEAGNTWFSIPQATNNFGYKWYAGNTTIATLSGNGTLTTGNITTTGSVSATNFVGNGVGLTNVTVSAAGNIVGTSSNVTLVAGNYSYTFDNTGNVTLPANVFVGVTNTFLPNTVASFSANVNYYSQVTLQNKSSGNDATADYIVTANNGSDTVNFLDLGIINSGYDNTTPSNSLGNIVFAADSYIYAQGNTSNANQSGGNLAIGTATTGKTIKFFAGGTTSSAIAMTVANTGVTVGGSITATGTFSGSGSGLTGVALKTTGSWTVTTGTGTYSFTVPASGTYQLWVDCNIPNGIIAWNATATITNSNVPVVGAQYAWVYNGGGSPIDFVSIPNQFTGTGNTIVRSSVAPSANTNRFDFGLNNTSGGNVTVRYGWVAIS
jgi:hypothetical protein